ncbi:hypothetical protein [Levilactobacillus fuyuanensis]|uniref:Uncharacterized protein n=1 Tax=Levilactobacillus fuyuanensis TaxID=2486022 RepID=A0ABW4H4C1_9LACO|nr:hypothetical protein [Levilactobacillus fuyuanensis]
MEQLEEFKRNWLLAVLGSALIGGGYGQAWLPMTELFRHEKNILR